MVASWATGLDCTPGPRARLSAVGVTGLLLTLSRSVALDGNSCPHEPRLDSASNGAALMLGALLRRMRPFARWAWHRQGRRT